MMTQKLAIVTTTINSPTVATKKFAKIASESNGKMIFIIAGDTKTPHLEYDELVKEYPSSVVYLNPELQNELFPEISNIIGWKTIERRNIGYLYAYHIGADALASVDDDNIPYDNWGENILVGKEIEYNCYENASCDFFDPLSITKSNHLWHRGYPIEHLQERKNNKFIGKKTKKCLVQANLWDGDPDIDAMARLVYKPYVDFAEITEPFGSEQISPFNSQNTIVAREVMPYFAMIPFVGRMDDIWGSYILQHYFPNSVIYDVATVYQDRNVQDLITNLEAEIIGYRKTLEIIKLGENFTDLFTNEQVYFWKTFRNYFNEYWTVHVNLIKNKFKIIANFNN